MPTAFLEVKKEPTINIVELKLPMTLQSDEIDQVNDAFGELLAGPNANQWILDLTGLNYMGSSALGLMVNVRQQIKQKGGRLVVCGMSPRLFEIFHTCSLERLFQIVKTCDDARKLLKH